MNIIDNYNLNINSANLTKLENAKKKYENEKTSKFSLNIENDKIVASETVGPHSKSYVNNANIIEKNILSDTELDNKCYKICYKYLVSTGLMYRGR